MFIFRHHRNGESLHTFKYNMVIWIVMWYTIGQPGLAEASLRGMVRLAGNTHFPLSFVTRITFDCLRRCLCITLCRFWFSPEHPVFQPRIFSVKMSDFTVRTCSVLFIVILFLTGTFLHLYTGRYTLRLLWFSTGSQGSVHWRHPGTLSLWYLPRRWHPH